VGLDQDLSDLGGGAPGRLALECGGEGEQLGRGARHPDPRVGQQRGEPALAPGPDPAVQRRARDAHPLAIRAEMVTLGEVAHQHPTLASSKRGVGGLPH
jgi:hypothetical protein